jgi:xanthine dehydrogenase accessory factor
MISGALSRAARELTEQGSAFVIATVVRVGHPTSVKPGNVALVHADGAIEGFVGGVCAQHSVRLYSLRSIESGEPLLLRILPDPAKSPGGDSVAGSAGAEPASLAPPEEDPSQTVEVSDDEGTVTVQNPCLSGGAIEVFLEPVLPAPRVLLAGDSPIIAALRRLGPELGLSLQSTADGGVPTRGDLGLIVAAHGRDELAVVQAALEAGLPYVGLVASRKRGAAVLDQLREIGVAQELLERVDTPAGLDIGARSAAEIALSILARVVEVRRRSAAGAAAGGVAAASRPVTAVDPICGMTIVVADDTPSLQHAGQTIYFCCMGCKLKFEERLGDAGGSLRDPLAGSLREPGGGESLRDSHAGSLREPGGRR